MGNVPPRGTEYAVIQPGGCSPHSPPGCRCPFLVSTKVLVTGLLSLVNLPVGKQVTLTAGGRATAGMTQRKYPTITEKASLSMEAGGTSGKRNRHTMKLDR